MLEDVADKIFELFDNRSLDRYPLKEYNHIGRRGVRRLDGYEKASGQALYTMDIALPGMLYAKFLTSPYPHASIVAHGYAQGRGTARSESDSPL